jgi:regulator of nucleoside diphosphate kinase
MSTRAILVTFRDRQELGTMLDEAYTASIVPQSQIAGFEMELEQAVGVPETDVPPDVVTMNSTVEIIDLESGEPETYTLVYPEQADITRDRISVLAPIGRAILGRAVGDVVSVVTPSGERWIKIAVLKFQPERHQQGMPRLHRVEQLLRGRP